MDLLKLEQSILGALLLDGDSSGYALSQLVPGDFGDLGHANIFRAMQTCEKNGEPMNIETVAPRAGKFGVAGSYLAALLDNAVLVDDLGWALNELKRHSAARAFKSILQAPVIPEEPSGVKGAIEKTADQLRDVAGAIDQQPMRSAADIVPIYLEQVKSAQESGGGLVGISTGFSCLNATLGGFCKGDMIVLAGRTSVGKTSLALNIAAAVASCGGHPVVYVSLEMSASSLFGRVACSHADVPFLDSLKGKLEPHQLLRLTAACAEIVEWPIYIGDRMIATANDVRALALDVRRRVGLGLIVVDYIQLMTARGRSQVEIVSSITRSLKLMAVELDVPLLALSQLNRGVDKEDRRPRLSDLRDSGTIEQDADAVVFLHRSNAAYAKHEILILKNRRGPIGEDVLPFEYQSMRFGNPVRE